MYSVPVSEFIRLYQHQFLNSGIQKQVLMKMSVRYTKPSSDRRCCIASLSVQLPVLRVNAHKHQRSALIDCFSAARGYRAHNKMHVKEVLLCISVSQHSRTSAHSPFARTSPMPLCVELASADSEAGEKNPDPDFQTALTSRIQMLRKSLKKIKSNLSLKQIYFYRLFLLEKYYIYWICAILLTTD